MHTSIMKQGINLPLPIGRQMLRYLQKAGSIPFKLLWKTNVTTPNIPPFLPPALCAYPQLGSAVLDGFPPQSLCIPSPLTGGVGSEGEKALMMCKHCSAIMITALS